MSVDNGKQTEAELEREERAKMERINNLREVYQARKIEKDAASEKSATKGQAILDAAARLVQADGFLKLEDLFREMGCKNDVHGQVKVKSLIYSLRKEGRWPHKEIGGGTSGKMFQKKHRGTTNPLPAYKSPKAQEEGPVLPKSPPPNLPIPEQAPAPVPTLPGDLLIDRLIQADALFEGLDEMTRHFMARYILKRHGNPVQ